MPSGVFKTADGWLQFLVVRQQQWLSICDVLEMPQLAADPRFIDEEARMRNEAELMGIVRPAIAQKPTAYWAERLGKADIMHERLNSFREFLTQPQAEAIGLIGWLNLAEAPEAIPVPNIAGMVPFEEGTPRATTPELGQHTADILREHGFKPAEIEALIERKVVAAAVGWVERQR
jgi:crotonobetainyl-CoA:carnitine CoA-transferase CaiB-like acyl-CoA transferase